MLRLVAVVTTTIDLDQKLILMATDQIDFIKLLINQKVLLLTHLVAELATVRKDLLTVMPFATQKGLVKSGQFVRKDRLQVRLVAIQKGFAVVKLLAIQIVLLKAR
jgi:hypothetical protein